MNVLVRYCCTYCAVHYLALSVVSIVGYFALKRARASSDVVRACGTCERVWNHNDVYLVAVSTRVMKYLLLCTEFGVIGPQTSDEILCPACLVCSVLLCGLVSVFPSMHPEHVIRGGLFCSARGRLGIIPCRAITAMVLGRRPNLRCQSYIILCAVDVGGDGGVLEAWRTW